MNIRRFVTCITVLSAFAIWIGVAPSASATRASNDAISATALTDVSAALSNVPTALREAFESTIRAKSFDVHNVDPLHVGAYGSGYENASIGLVVRMSKLTCPSDSNGTSGSTAEIVYYNSSRYSVEISCPGDALSLCKYSAPPTSYGLNPSLSAIFAFWIEGLHSSGNFQPTSTGFTWDVAENAYPDLPGSYNEFRGVPGSAVIHDGRLVSFTQYINYNGLSTWVTTFSHYNDAPKVTLPKNAVNSCS